MKSILSSLALTMGMLSGWCNEASGQTKEAAEFKPLPVVQTKFIADPAPMVYRDTVYLFTNHDEDDAEGFHMKDWQCYTSPGWCLHTEDWGRTGRFLFTARHSGHSLPLFRAPY